MPATIRIVQFLHPGPEHRPGRDGRKPWNTRDKHHRRTFVRQPGRCLRRLGETAVESELDFWCEWEPEAELISPGPKAVPRGPRHLFRPLLPPPRNDFAGLHNTDPCVFGGFCFCACKQSTYKSLKQLAPGSVLLFGSCLDDQFVLDTVFVVASHERYDGATYLDLDVPEAYREIALAPLFPEVAPDGTCRAAEPDRWFQLYRGASVDRPVAGMFSFFPCMPAGDGPGFARPAIRMAKYVTDNHKQGIKGTAVAGVEAAQAVWEDVVGQVRDQGLWLGVEAEMPQRRT